MCFRTIVAALSFLLGVGLTNGLDFYYSENPNFAPGREVIVHLHEWKWKDIADECERFLGPKGFAGVQTAPVTENIILATRPWIERYMPISYRWITRSGNESEFKDMVKRCNQVGVRIYVELVLNHMTRNQSVAFGTGGSTAIPAIRDYPGVPYTTNDFNPHCIVQNRSDMNQIRNCWFIGHDLNQKNEKVKRKIVQLMNDLIAAGVAGFLIDAATYMWPEDLKEIYSRLRSLEMNHGFPYNARPYIYQKVYHMGSPVFSKYEYNAIGAVTEILYSLFIAKVMSGPLPLKKLKNFREEQSMLPSDNAIIFVENHNWPRHLDVPMLTRVSPKLYKMAIAFMLAHPYGKPILMSSYVYRNASQGPPADANENIISPIINNDGSCDGGWVCEHRWPQIFNMVDFRNIVSGTSLNDWWDNDNRQIAFSRGDRGFIAINGENADFVENIRTKLPPGFYCDVISGNFDNGHCSGKIVVVDESGKVKVRIHLSDEDGVIAIHRNSRLSDSWA